MLLVIAAIAGVVGSVVAGTTHTVVMDGTRFIPKALTVKRGDRVVWINKDFFPHTATAGRTFDSKSIAAGGSWSYIADTPGALAYVCTLHPGMKGTLIVQ
jgi:plastocyanin